MENDKDVTLFKLQVALSLGHMGKRTQIIVMATKAAK